MTRTHLDYYLAAAALVIVAAIALRLTLRVSDGDGSPAALVALVAIVGVIFAAARLDMWQFLLFATVAGTFLTSEAGQYVIGRDLYLGDIGIVLLAAWCAHRYRHGTSPNRLSDYATSKLVVLAIFATLSFVWSPYRGSTLLHGLAVVGLAIFVRFTARGRWTSADAIERDVRLVFNLCAGVLGLCLFLFLIGHQIRVPPIESGGQLVVVPSDRLRGIFANPNAAGITAAIVLPVGVGLALASRGPNRWRYALAAALSGAVIVLSGSRTSMAAAVLGVFAIAARRGGQQGWKMLVSISPLALVALAARGQLAALPGVARTVSTFSSANIGVATSGRTVAWSESIRLWHGSPIAGIGFSAGPPTFTRLEAAGQLVFGADSAHDGYLQILMELGIVGLVLLVPIAFALLRAPSRPQAWWAGCYGAVVAGLVVQFGESSILGIDSMFAPVFWIFAIAAISVRLHPVT